MSMLAIFVQVEPALVARIEDDPSLIEDLFASSLGILNAETMRGAILERGPQLLAGAIDLHPELRELVEQRLGVTQEALRQGSGAEQVLRLMGEESKPEASADERRTLSLDKAWHGVHYLLCGAIEPDGTVLGQATLGGKEMGDDFSGYGPARFFEPAEVNTLADALADPDTEAAAEARFDPHRMTELQIYPFGWADEDNRAWLLSSLRELTAFYTDAAERGCGVATCLE